MGENRDKGMTDVTEIPMWERIDQFFLSNSYKEIAKREIQRSDVCSFELLMSLRHTENRDPMEISGNRANTSKPSSL